MTDIKKCPQCGADLPADAPAGICPKCLLAVGMASDTAVRGEQSDDAPTTPLPGSTRFVPPAPSTLAGLFPQLEILELIGVGGMGAVYKARQKGLDRLVAIKILPPEVGADPAFAQRFTREAQALARLSHQHIVPVYDFGVADGLYYFIMEYVEGANLRQLIKTGELKPPEALAIVPQICEALQFAHDEGVVHRDIKPENILLDKRGRVKIADFGLARLLGTTAPELSLTGTNQVLGTLHYMAPEQVQGLRTVDHRADIYSLGVVFYEMLTGELPLGRFAPPSHKVGVDIRLDEVVLRSLESKPERRYQHVSEVKTDIEAIGEDSARVLLQSSNPRHIAGQADIRLIRQQLAIPATLMEIAGLVMGPAAILLGVLHAVGQLPEDHFSIYATALLMLIGGCVLALTGLKLNRLESYGLGVATSLLILPICSYVPIMFYSPTKPPPAFYTFASLILLLPVSVWLLILLLRPETKAAFAHSAADKVSSVKLPEQRLHWPAIALIVAGLLDLAEVLLCIACIILFFAVMPPGGKTPEGHHVAFGGLYPVPAIIFGIPALILGLLRLVGSVRMLRLKSFGFVSFAAVSSLLPVTLGSLLGVPASIWALIVLSQSDVRSAFAPAKSGRRHEGSVESNSDDERMQSAISPAIVTAAQRDALPISGELSAKNTVEVEEQQRTAELAERAPAWLAFVELGLFGLGWLFVGAMWNFGSLGLYIGFAVLAAIIYLAIRWNLVYLPKLKKELLRQSRLRRGFALAAGLVIFTFAMLFLIAAQTSYWDMLGNPSPSVSSINEQHDQLFAAAKSAKLGELSEKAFNVQTVGPMSYRSAWEPLLYATFGFSFVMVAIGVAIDTRRYRNSWKYGGRTAVSIAVLLFTMLLINVPIFMPKGTGRLPRREVRSAATLEQLQTAVQKWGKKNGYVVDVQSSGAGSGGGERDLRLAPVDKLKPADFGTGFAGFNGVSTSKDGKQYVIKDGKVWEQVSEKFHDNIEVVRFRLSRPSALDLYRTSWHGTYRPRPPLTITSVTKKSTRSEGIHQSFGPETTTIDSVAQIEPTWEWLGTPESALWEPILNELEAEVRAASNNHK